MSCWNLGAPLELQLRNAPTGNATRLLLSPRDSASQIHRAARHNQSIGDH